jgi:hypothetical protein
VQKSVRDERDIILLPRQLWCSLKGNKDGETCCEVGWLFDRGSAVTSRCIFSSDVKLKASCYRLIVTIIWLLFSQRFTRFFFSLTSSNHWFEITRVRWSVHPMMMGPFPFWACLKVHEISWLSDLFEGKRTLASFYVKLRDRLTNSLSGNKNSAHAHSSLFSSFFVK